MKAVFIALALTVAISSVSAQTVKVDGSSTLFRLTEGIAEDFQKATKTKVTVGISGTGGGFKKFCRGETDVQNASRPISQKEIDDCKKAGVNFIELPVAFDALSIIVSPRNTFVKELTVQELKTMWEPSAQGKITNWNQINPKFPNRPLKLFGAGADSGTFDYFTEAVMGRSKASRGDFTASEDDNVIVLGVAKDADAIGYLGYAYYIENQKRLKSVAIINKQGEPVLPSEKTVMNGSYNPMSRPLMIYVNSKSLDKAEVLKFIDYYNKNAAAMATEVKYVPLPEQVYKNNYKLIQTRKTGSIFGGHNEVGMSVEDLINRTLK